VILRTARTAALWGITVLVAASTLVAFAESYRALYLWARRHQLDGAWAYAWPLQIDTFLAVGELALVVALSDRWLPRSRAAAWAVTGIGLAVSVAGNVGHAAGGSVTARATAAVPPLAAAAALAVGLGVLKRCASDATGTGSAQEAVMPETAPEPLLMAGPVDDPKLEGTALKTAPADDLALEAKALELLAGDLTMSGAALARALGVSESYGRKLRRRLTSRTAHERS
jgi:hypothetical protein